MELNLPQTRLAKTKTKLCEFMYIFKPTMASGQYEMSARSFALQFPLA